MGGGGWGGCVSVCVLKSSCKQGAGGGGGADISEMQWEICFPSRDLDTGVGNFLSTQVWFFPLCNHCPQPLGGKHAEETSIH